MSQPKLKIKKGDTVVVIAGKDKGKKGKVLNTRPATRRVVVEGINIVKRHQRPSRAMPQGGITEAEAPLHASNVMVICNKCDRPVRVGKKETEGKERVRYCKRCGNVLD